MLAILTIACALSPSPPPAAGTLPLLRNHASRAIETVKSVPTGVRSLVLIDDAVRGRDQRALPIRALAAVHPRIRLLFLLVCCAVACALWLVPAIRDGKCTTIDVVPGPLVLLLCRAAVALGSVAAAIVATAIWLAVSARRAAAEEAKDAALTEELRAAAAASASYEESPEARLRELNARGVDSGNWRVDDDLSTDEVGVFVNSHEQYVIVAYRGTMTLGDWGSNLRRIVPGDEEGAESFQRALQLTRKARDKYLLYASILLTGHSRGGAIADFVGRKLGLPTTTFNPATWGKVLRQQEPAAQSNTVKTPIDLVSVLEAFFPGDRTIVLRLPKGFFRLLMLPLLSVLCLCLSYLLGRTAGRICVDVVGFCYQVGETALLWLWRVGWLCVLLTTMMLVGYSHTVTHFTKR